MDSVMPEPVAMTVDYEARYGPVDDAARLTTILEDASNILLSKFAERYGRPYEKGASPSFDLNAAAVACSMARRALSAPAGFEGASQLTQTAGPYSASLTYANPNGEVYATRSELKRLGLVGCRVGSIRPGGGCVG